MEILVDGVNIVKLVGNSISEYSEFGYLIVGFYFGLFAFKIYLSTGINKKIKNKKINSRK